MSMLISIGRGWIFGAVWLACACAAGAVESSLSYLPVADKKDAVAKPPEAADKAATENKQDLDMPPVARTCMEDGYTELRVGNLENAIRAFKRGLEAAPEHPRLLCGLGTAYIRAERYAQAIEVLTRAHELRPNDYVIVNNLAWIYCTARDARFRDGGKAVALARQAVLLAPDDPHTWSTMADAYYVSGNYKLAVRAAREALRLSELTQPGTEVTAGYRDQVQRCEVAEKAMDILQ